MLNDSPRLDRAFQALSDPVRRGMLTRLSRGPASVSELAAPLTISLPAVVESRKSGRVRTVQLQPKVLSAAESWLAEQRSTWEGRVDRFETYLATIKKEDSE
jgi:DNA-binding transcriptional ArsR family regulator